MARLLGAAGAVAVAVVSFSLLGINVVQASSVHVQEAGAIHVQEAGGIHVQEAELQLLESAGLETVVIDGETAHVL